MILAYLIALLPIIAGGAAWVLQRKIVWFEWLICGAAALLTAFVFNCIAVLGMTSDTETWSGQIVDTTFHPEWVEEYEVAIYKTETYTDTETDSKGRTQTVTRTRQVFSHYEKRYRTHYEFWDCDSSLQTTYDISKGRHDEIVQNFGGQRETRHVSKGGFYSGDPNVYVAVNNTGYIYPVTTWRTWENKVKAAPSLFSYTEISEKIPVLGYPSNENIWLSDRVMGTCTINRFEWDRMNARLGPVKKVNVIIIGFNGQDSSIAHQQEAKWVGGKKNDLVLCYGDGWSYVFGWTEKDIVKANLSTLLIQNPVDTALIPKIEDEILKHYRIKDWSKFDYITVEPPTWSYWILFLVMGLVQGGCWCWAWCNDVDKLRQPADFDFSVVRGYWDRLKSFFKRKFSR